MNQLFSLKSLRLLLPTAIALLPGHFSAFADNPTNTSLGVGALPGNTKGHNNTGLGFTALEVDSAGAGNTATGASALASNTTGSNNTATGYGALGNNTTGNNNTSVGYLAGSQVIDASNVICIGANLVGANVSNTTWIGGVYGVQPQDVPTTPVVVSANGQLGSITSSERFKKDIASMDKTSEAILSLRPVTFHYKSDSKDTPQFGLIAEEVAKVNPALVLPDKEGKPYSVRYEAVNAMLLNEFLKEHRKVEQLEKEIAALTARLQKVSAQLATASPSLADLK
jgi:hypothetical protein